MGYRRDTEAVIDDAHMWPDDFDVDGPARLRMRPLVASDKQKLAEGLMRLSPQSRYFRFFTEKTRFTEAELAYLTEVDGDRHFALGVAHLRPDGTEGDGVAVGRFVRLPDTPDVAEAAIAVTDDMHARGIGRRLLERLIQAARARGIRAFRMEFLSLNRPMQDLLASVSPGATFSSEGSVVVAQFPIGDDADADPAGELVTDAAPSDPPARERIRLPALREWMRMVADGAVDLRQSFAMWLDVDQLRALVARLRGSESAANEVPPRDA
jgi:GNAT superfamily N-acetyltransferase